MSVTDVESVSPRLPLAHWTDIATGPVIGRGWVIAVGPPLAMIIRACCARRP